MPDLSRRTVSASEMAALFNASPYSTRFTLYHEFIGDLPKNDNEDGRMSWGSKMEPLCLEQAADDLKLVVRPNVGPDGRQEYITNGLLGCHRDGDILCPDRGPGAIENKVVFDFSVWQREWSGGRAPPRHVELQLQTQMKVGRYGRSFDWGVISAWIAGEQKYFERRPLPELWEQMDAEAAKFLDEVKSKSEPDPFGVALEAPILARLFPVEKGTVMDLREIGDDTLDVLERVRMLDYHSKNRLSHEKAEKDLKAWIMGKMQGVETLLLPHGANVKLRQQSRGAYSVKPTTFQVVDAYVPENIEGGDLKPFEGVDIGG